MKGVMCMLSINDPCYDDERYFDPYEKDEDEEDDGFDLLEKRIKPDVRRRE